ncbi:MAG TPA: hypothetical protein VGF33_03050 [Caulobacteraceae bacterium]
MPKPKKRPQRRHNQLPPGFTFTRNRYRWMPSPARRKQGWRGCELKATTQGEAIDAARKLADAVKAWDTGEPVDATYAALAPQQTAFRERSLVEGPLSIGALVDEWKASPKFLSKSRSTQDQYRRRIAQFLVALAGDEAKVAKIRCLDVRYLMPPAAGTAKVFHLQRVYDAFHDQSGAAAADGIHRTVSSWLGWVVKPKNALIFNPASRVEIQALKGRIVTWEFDELRALVAAAESLGFLSVADAIILAVDLGWPPGDLLAITWGQIDAEYRVHHRRLKTGVTGRPPLLPNLGLPRIRQIAARQGAVPPTGHVLISEATGRPWDVRTFARAFAEVRALVARTHPAALDKQFRDLRDTAITVGYEAELTIPQICSRSLHDPKRAQEVIQKHYGAIRQTVANAAADKLDAHFTRVGFSLDQPLALPAPA